MKSAFLMIAASCSLLIIGCSKSGQPLTGSPRINFIFKFDSTQARLNAIGQPSVMPAGHAGQSPVFNSMSAHYLELSPGNFTPLGAGQVLYHAPQVSTGGASAIDFSRSKFAGQNEVFLSVPLDSVAAGTYNWLRVSLAYQNYNIRMQAFGQTLNTTVASFIGFNTYINQLKIRDSILNVNSNKLQGFWAFETSAMGVGFVSSGQAPAGATTVPNPLATTSPIPAGSCVVTGQFNAPLIVTGNETSDINIVVSLSTNKSFEWVNADGNNTFDPLNGDAVVDMGIRGMLTWKQ